ncbi:MAG: DNA-primase RepB domain-containing protein [Phycisphaerae bacterium]
MDHSTYILPMEQRRALDHDAVATLLALLFALDDVVEIRCIPPRDRPDLRPYSHWYPAVVLILPGHEFGGAAAVEQIASANARGYGVYFGINPRRSAGLRGDDAIPLARCHFVDIDDPTLTVAALVERIHKAGWPEPEAIVNSGHGLWSYWMLDKPCTDLTVWRRRQGQLATLLGADPTCKNPERVGRLPGYFNTKAIPFIQAQLLKPEVSHVN